LDEDGEGEGELECEPGKGLSETELTRGQRTSNCSGDTTINLTVPHVVHSAPGSSHDEGSEAKESEEVEGRESAGTHCQAPG
jgi:hypothetical protein